jgi:magnesium transporter
MINYLTQLLGKPAFDPDGKKVGRIVDVIASQGGRLPTVTAVFLKGSAKEGWISLDDAAIEEDAIRLRAAWDSLPIYEPMEKDLRLQRDILDKQIVDVHDYRVVRVNDVRLAACGDQMCVVGADASLRGRNRNPSRGPGEADRKAPPFKS